MVGYFPATINSGSAIERRPGYRRVRTKCVASSDPALVGAYTEQWEPDGAYAYSVSAAPAPARELGLGDVAPPEYYKPRILHPGVRRPQLSTRIIFKNHAMNSQRGN